MKEVVASGRTVEEAIALALERAGLTRDEAEIHVLDEGTRGVFGIGAREARVRVVPRAAVAEQTVDAALLQSASEMAREVLARMGYSATVYAHGTERGLALDVRGEDLGPLIGRRGQGIEALETVLSAMIHRVAGTGWVVELDVGGYRARRRQHLAHMAQRAAQRAVAEGRPVHLPPMDARERRIIHTWLAGDRRVATRSEGAGKERHVVVEPASGVRPPRAHRRPPPRRAPGHGT